MGFPRRARYLVSVILAGASLAQATGCSGWVSVAQPTPRSLADGRWQDLRVTVEGDLSLELAHARISGDSVIGVLRALWIGTKRTDTAKVSLVLRRFGAAAERDSVVAVSLRSAVRVERYSDPLGPLPIFLVGGLVVYAVIRLTGQGSGSLF
jgi:hypothetical protein